MSQSATLYRVSQDTFKQLNTSGSRQRFDITSAKSYTVFHGTFMGLEYILSKGQTNSTTELVSQIFNPKQSIGEQELEALTPEEQLEFYENGSFIPYLDTLTIANLNDFFKDISLEDIRSNYDATELNGNHIYPYAWHNDNSFDLVYNERHILEDFRELATIIKQAEIEKDFIIVFVG
ncbi:DUF1877 family protein [Foetidibacter luteolus]|uniref:DUF1877 family protein n=1 Tax=Foetidibacter luteolus TaxID=2608880 RepID=UPI00129A0D83|nr:DUF1877 family protein [Foetidibacter luteolus]